VRRRAGNAGRENNIDTRVCLSETCRNREPIDIAGQVDVRQQDIYEMKSGLQLCQSTTPDVGQILHAPRSCADSQPHERTEQSI
jgi:hypothetical protein